MQTTAGPILKRTHSVYLGIFIFTTCFMCFSLLAANNLQEAKLDSGTAKHVVKSDEPMLVKALLDGGININTVFEFDGTLLIMAIRSGSDHIVSYLLQNGADVNLESPVDGNALIVAARHNRLAIAQQLIDAGAKIDAWVENDETALINASREGHYEMVKYLLENGADANYGVRAKEGFRSPLNQAKTESIRSLLKKHGAKK